MCFRTDTKNPLLLSNEIFNDLAIFKKKINDPLNDDKGKTGDLDQQ